MLYRRFRPLLETPGNKFLTQDIVAVDDLRFENCGLKTKENAPCMELDKFECPYGDFFSEDNSGKPTCISRTYVCDFQVSSLCHRFGLYGSGNNGYPKKTYSGPLMYDASRFFGENN